MTELEWLGSSKPCRMVDFVRDKISTRKLRWFACACCRRSWSIATHQCRRLIELVEKDADKRYTGVWIPNRLIDAASIASQESAIGLPAGSKCAQGAAYFLHHNRMEAVVAIFAARAAINGEWGEDAEDARKCEQEVQMAILRDIVGNPFRPLTIDPSWMTSTVVAIARELYESRDFSVMPILADALQDAGCEEETVLNHCRQPGIHVRGCWLLDALLGKS